MQEQEKWLKHKYNQQFSDIYIQSFQWHQESIIKFLIIKLLLQF